MRALVFDRPAIDSRASHVTELAVPEPAPGTVTIDVHYAGVNFKDVMARRGDPGHVSSWPFVAGREVAGTVRALGAGVTGLEVGDRVTAFTNHGGLAEVAVAPAALTVRVPGGLGLERAVAAPGALATAALLLRDFGHLRPGEIVLVHSATGRWARRCSGSREWRARDWSSGWSAAPPGWDRPIVPVTTPRSCAAPVSARRSAIALATDGRPRPRSPRNVAARARSPGPGSRRPNRAVR